MQAPPAYVNVITFCEVAKQGVGLPRSAESCVVLRRAPAVSAVFPTYTLIIERREPQQSERAQSCTSVMEAA